MEAARLLYGELELDADQAIQTVEQVDNGLNALKEIIEANMKAMQSMTEATTSIASALNNFSGKSEDAGDDVGMFSDAIKSSESFMKSFYTTLNNLSKMSFLDVFLFFAEILISLIANTEEFQYVLDVLEEVLEPIKDLFIELGETLAKFLLPLIFDAINLFVELIDYFTQTEQGLALLKIAAIFFAVVAGVLLIASLNSIAVAAYGAMTAFFAMITPLLPFIAIAAAVAAAITAVILVLEDLYLFGTGEGESVAGEFFTMLGLSKEEIEAVRIQIKEFIDSVKETWDSLTKGVGKLVPAFKKIFSALFSIAKLFFVQLFKYIFEMAKIFSGVWDIIKGIFTGNFDLILDGFRKIGSGIIGIFKGMTDFIAGLFNNLLEMIAPIKEIAANLFGGNSPKPIAGARANGGSVEAGKNYIVGDGGEAEVFTPGASGFITPKSKIGNSSSSTSNSSKSTIASIIGTVNIVVQGGENMASDLTQKIKDVIRQASIEAAQELGLQI